MGNMNISANGGLYPVPRWLVPLSTLLDVETRIAQQ